MTCVIGLVQNDVVYMGADSQGSDGWDKHIVVLPKVFRTGQFLIGYTSSFRMGQLLQYQLKVRTQRGSEDRYTYMVTAVVEAVRVCLKDYGWSKVENNQEEGGSFLIGYRGKLYEIHPDMSVLENTYGFSAVGCGRSYALAAMAALTMKPARERIIRALEIAALFSNGVSGPFNFLKLGGA